MGVSQAKEFELFNLATSLGTRVGEFGAVKVKASGDFEKPIWEIAHDKALSEANGVDLDRDLLRVSGESNHKPHDLLHGHN